MQGNRIIMNDEQTNPKALVVRYKQTVLYLMLCHEPTITKSLSCWVKNNQEMKAMHSKKKIFSLDK